MSQNNSSSMLEPQIWELVAEWDNLEQPLAPLSDEQQKTILDLSNLCANKLWIAPKAVSNMFENVLNYFS